MKVLLGIFSVAGFGEECVVSSGPTPVSKTL